MADPSRTNDENHATQGKVFFDGGDYARAAAEYSLAIAADPAMADLYTNRAYAYLRLGRANEAFVDFDKAIELEPAKAQRYLVRALASLSLNRMAAAEADCGRAIERDPKSAAAHSLRSVIEIGSGRYDAAIADCDAAIRIDPRFAAAYENRGLAYLDKKDYTRAIADSTKGIELDKLSPEGFDNRGVAYRALGLADKALADWTSAIAVAHGGHEQSYINRADLYRERGEWDKAIADYSLLLKTRLMQLDEQLARSAHAALAGRRAPADAATPQTVSLLIGRAAAFVGRGDPAACQQAIADCSLAIVANPAAAEAYRVRGAAYRGLGEKTKAEADEKIAHRLGGK